MRHLKFTFFVFSIFVCLLFSAVDKLNAQSNLANSQATPSALKNISLAGFTLCRTTLMDLRKEFKDLKETTVEEMDVPPNCSLQDTRYIPGKGFSTESYPAFIFQLEKDSSAIGKIRITKEFKGQLPNGKMVDVSKLKAKDVVEMYPHLKERWGYSACSNYLKVSNDTISFFVKIDSSRKPLFPIDQEYYANQPIEAIDLVSMCYAPSGTPKHFSTLEAKAPVFVLDGVRISKADFSNLGPENLALFKVYKDKDATDRFGIDAINGVVYAETLVFAKKKYWSFFKSKSKAYLNLVPKPGDEKEVVYIVNNKPLLKHSEGDLSSIDPGDFIDLTIINKRKLKKYYQIEDRNWGVMINVQTK